MALENLLQPHRVIIHSRSETWQELLREVGGTFRTPDEVTENFVEALLEREENYPTGLPTRPIAVALPHADGAYVHKAGLALCTLSQPVLFRQMGAPELSASVQLVICIALPEEKRDEQVILLGHLLDKIQNDKFVQQVITASTIAQVVKTFESM